jgi:hypothetical protein
MQGKILATELRGVGERELNFCQNANANWLALPFDESCSDAAPDCVDGNDVEDTWWNAHGDGCVVCVNDKSGDSSRNSDKGCTNGKP